MSALHFDLNSKQVTIFGPFLDQLVAIHDFYQQRGERVVGVTTNCQLVERFEAGVMREHKLYHVKLRISDSSVLEYGREEDC